MARDDLLVERKSGFDGEKTKKQRSREAARQRRGQQNDEFSELAMQLPLPDSMGNSLDRLCVMRLSNSFIKIKHILEQLKGVTSSVASKTTDLPLESQLQEALGGFMFVVAEDGQCLYISPNVQEYLGLPQLEINGNSFYKYIHPCDQDEFAKQLGGQVPLEDMEIFDSLYCTEGSSHFKNPKQATDAQLSESPYRSFFMRMKSTLTSRGKNVNLSASIYRVVHCTGTMQMYNLKFGQSGSESVRCLLATGTPLLSTANFEVPVDRATFTTKHTLDMKMIDCEDILGEVVGYKPSTMVGTSWYLYVHMCDAEVLRVCHKTLLSKGQAVSGYYRVLSRNGGWVWIQSKANVVYLSSTGQPQYIVCVHYVISGLELQNLVLASEQMSSVVSRKPVGSKRNYSSEVLSNSVNRFVETKLVETEPLLAKFPLGCSSDNVGPLPFMAPPISVVDESDDDHDDTDSLPGLEFVDVNDEFESLTTSKEQFSGRTPFIPPPLTDEKVGGVYSETDQSDLENFLDGSIDLIARAPFIPPPFIDTLLTFDDLKGSSSYLDGADFPPSPQRKFEMDKYTMEAVRNKCIDDSSCGGDCGFDGFGGWMHQLNDKVKVPHHLFADSLQMSARLTGK